MKSIIANCIGLFMLTALISEMSFADVTQFPKIIGDNNLIKVKRDGSNVDSNLRSYLNAFGVVDLGEGVCTGTHIGNGYVITAGHCFMPEGVFGSLQNKGCEKVKMHWGYRGSPDTGSAKPLITGRSQCTQIIYAEHTFSRDFAVIKVDKAPKAKLPISISGMRPGSGTKLTILGFPQGRPLEWSQYCKLISGTSVSAALFGYTCDTEPGNSGSAVIALNSNGLPTVIGIHNAGGMPDEEFNIGTYLADVMNIVKSQAGVDLTQVTQKFE